MRTLVSLVRKCETDVKAAVKMIFSVIYTLYSTVLQIDVGH